MIWHFLEVWLLMLAAFVAGSTIGAIIYDLTARSAAAAVQGRLADAVGDVVDGIKTRLGLGPVWRPEYRRVLNRRAPADDDDALVRFADEGGAMHARRLMPEIAAPGDDDDGAPTADPDAAYGFDEEWEEELPPEANPILPMRPAGLAGPRNGVPDNLQRIRGVGERNEELLNSLGIFHFGQIAAWTPGEVRWVGAYLAFPERIERDDWVGQATILASGGDTGFTKAADRRRERRRRELEDEADLDRDGESGASEIGEEPEALGREADESEPDLPEPDEPEADGPVVADKADRP